MGKLEQDYTVGMRWGVVIFLTSAALQAQTLATFSSATAGGCRLTKQPSSTVLATWGCKSADAAVQQAGTLKASPSGTPQPASFTFGPQINVLCLIMINPASSPVTAGSLPNAPANGISWSCTTDGAAPQNGTAQWP